MESLFISKDCKLSCEGRTILVSNEAGKRRIPVAGLSQIVLAGEAGMTTASLTMLGRNNIRVVVLDWHGNVAGSFEPQGMPRSGKVRMMQARISSCDASRTDLARRILQGAGANILANLRYRRYRGTTGLKDIISGIERAIEGFGRAVDVPSLMGHEGSMRAFYYDAWPIISPKLAFGARVRRPPNNPVNCLISWFNGLTYNLCRNEIAKTHLDDCLSFLHSPHEARASLALDLSEVFKPALADTLIFEAMLRRQDIDRWFLIEDGVCRLSPAGRKDTLEAWARKIDEHAPGKESFRTIVRSEALAIERHVLGIGEYRAWRRKI